MELFPESPVERASDNFTKLYLKVQEMKRPAKSYRNSIFCKKEYKEAVDGLNGVFARDYKKVGALLEAGQSTLLQPILESVLLGKSEFALLPPAH